MTSCHSMTCLLGIGKKEDHVQSQRNLEQRFHIKHYVIKLVLCLPCFNLLLFLSMMLEKITSTTSLNIFTNGLIPSGTRMKSVGEIITDGLTDGIRLSVYQSSVTPIFIAKSVANKKNTHWQNTDGLTDGYARAKKKVSRGNITDGINPSAISTVITDSKSVGNYGMASNCLPTLCEIPTDLIRR